MKNHKVFLPSEMEKIFSLYRSTKSMDAFVEKVMDEYPEVESREVVLMWQTFDHMYDNFNIQEVE